MSFSIFCVENVLKSSGYNLFVLHCTLPSLLFSKNINTKYRHVQWFVIRTTGRKLFPKTSYKIR